MAVEPRLVREGSFTDSPPGLDSDENLKEAVIVGRRTLDVPEGFRPIEAKIA